MGGVPLICLFTASALAQTATFGAFSKSDDVGAPPLKGSAEFDAATGHYRITGSPNSLLTASRTARR
jgi:hypothetical protein